MQKREFGVDLFRIMAALLVILLHVLGCGGVLQSAAPESMAYWCAWLLEICAYCAVNCFALISGYLMAERAVKIKSIVGLWLQVLFYSVVISSLFFFFLPETRTAKNMIFALTPVISGRWWYVSSYFVLFFFIPVLNLAIKHISQNTYKKLLTVALIGICVFDCVSPQNAFGISYGYSALWLIILYLFGAYIKKYDIKCRTTALKSILGFISMVLLTFLSKIGIHYVTKSVFGQSKFSDAFVSFTSITVVLAAIFLFLFCLNLRIGKASQKLIGVIAPTSLSIYLIHVHPFVFWYIIKDAFVSFAHKPLPIMILCILAATLSIFIVCFVVESLRIGLFKLIRADSLCAWIDKKTSCIWGRKINR